MSGLTMTEHLIAAQAKTDAEVELINSEIARQVARRKEVEEGLENLKRILLEDCDFAIANLRERLAGLVPAQVEAFELKEVASNG